MAVDDVLAVFRLALERAAVHDAPPLCILILDWAKYCDRIPALLVAEVFLAHCLTPWYHGHRYLPLFTDGWHSEHRTESQLNFTLAMEFPKGVRWPGLRQSSSRTASVGPSIA